MKIYKKCYEKFKIGLNEPNDCPSLNFDIQIFTKEFNFSKENFMCSKLNLFWKYGIFEIHL